MRCNIEFFPHACIIVYVSHRMKVLRLTLWGKFATNQGEILFNELHQDHVLCISSVAVGDYHGTNLFHFRLTPYNHATYTHDV